LINEFVEIPRLVPCYKNVGCPAGTRQGDVAGRIAPMTSMKQVNLVQSLPLTAIDGAALAQVDLIKFPDIDFDDFATVCSHPEGRTLDRLHGRKRAVQCASPFVGAAVPMGADRDPTRRLIEPVRSVS
jgi:hypothetical protein